MPEEEKEKKEKSNSSKITGAIAKGFMWSLVSIVVMGAMYIIGIILIVASGGSWGRPLRVKGKQVHAELSNGNDWTRGEKPDVAGLDKNTRDVLEALWLHDAKKEHASVPAFSRISWMLVAVGAPADLVEWSHRAAIEEIEHTQLCFALAQGYANSGQSKTVKPMPFLLKGGLDLKEDALLVLAKESLEDGCQLEDYNADVAAACALVCKERVTKNVLKQIALEERSHAEFSWKLLEWTLAVRPQDVTVAIKKAYKNLENYKRPTAVSWDKKHLLKKADTQQLLNHGRIPDEQWARIWDERLLKTKQRLDNLLDSQAKQKIA